MSDPQLVKVLVVDDNPKNLLVLESLLDEIEVETISATSGNEALAKMARHNFAVVLLDAHMPQMDGFETAELMRGSERTRHTPIIFVTEVFKDQEYCFKGYDVGAVDYLTKPIEPAILRGKVKIFVEIFKQRQQVEQALAGLQRSEERLRTAISEKEVLLREVHHRVKNNMQVITSLLRLHANRVTVQTALDAFADCQNRIRAMALVHETLFQSEDLSSVSCQEYLGKLVNDLSRAQRRSGGQVEVVLEVDEIPLHMDQAVPLGLIVNELVTNAFEHAFADQGPGKVRVAMGRIGSNDLELVVSDDGVGLPEQGDIEKVSSMGLHLVARLAKDQLGGTFEPSTDAGARFLIRFKSKPSKAMA